MRKIYPSLFNKFAVLIIYGLLSVAVITLAQVAPNLTDTGCILNSLPSNVGLQTIGYVQLYANHPPIEPGSIPWNLYNYINVIAFPNTEAPGPGPWNGPWNGLTQPDLNSDAGKDMDIKLKGLVQSRNNTNPSTKVLLSIRNYDLTKWSAHQNDIPATVNNIIRTYGLDGVDIEYPGMRGSLCHQGGNNLIWNKENDDADFIGFMTNLRGNITDNKTIMLTVGVDVIQNPNSLNGNIDILNIEIYHYSLFQNTRDHSRMSHANNPLIIFDNAFRAWNTSGVGDNVQRFMGVDFGNTLQVVFTQQIENTQAVLIGVESEYPPRDNGKLTRSEFPANSINIITGICPADEDGVTLYTFSWKQFSTSILNHTIYCNKEGSANSQSGWIRKFDNTEAFTPWLYKQLDPTNNPSLHLYISYEDAISLNRKISYAMGKSIAGMSISDVTYDDNSLLYMLTNKQSGVGGAPGSAIPGSPGSSGPSGSSNPSSDNGSPSSSVTPTNNDQNEGNRKSGVIAGAVIGSIFGLAIIGGIAFFGYKNRDKLPFGQNQQYSKNMSYNQGTFNQPGAAIIPNNSPRMVLPDTAAIPVAPSYVTAMFDFIGKEENDLSFKKGDKIEVLERGDGPNDWWVGRVNGAVGEFPGNYVRE